MEQQADTASDRFRRVAGTFGAVVAAVPDDGWSRPAPPEGWVAADVVDHLLTWVPAVLGPSGLEFPSDPSAQDDPLGAWTAFAATIQTALDDPAVAGRTFDAGPPGEMTVEQAVDMLVTGDVLVHTWDLARATGQDIELDAAVAAPMADAMLSMGDVLVASGHYRPATPVPDGADPTTRVVAATGRDPGWRPPG